MEPKQTSQTPPPAAPSGQSISEQPPNTGIDSSSSLPAQTPEFQQSSSAFPPVGQTPPPQKSHRSFAVAVIGFAILILLIIGAFIAFSYFQNNAKQNPAHVKVGLMMAFSGGSSSMGYGASKGVQLAKKQLGADNIEIVQQDSKCDPKTAAEAIKSLIAQNVAAIIGEGCSSASVAALPAANNAKIPMISPSASSPTLSIPNDYFFRVVPPDTFQGSYMAQYIYDRDIRNVAVFYTNEPYGSGMNGVFRDKFESLGGKVVATASGEPDVIDLANQMRELKAAKPQAIFIAPNSVVSATAAVKLAREVGITVPFFGADIMYDTSIITNAGKSVEGLTITSFPTGTRTFKQSIFNEYQKTEPLYAAPQAYDIIHALQIAIQQGATTGEKIKEKLPSVSFQGVSGNIKFDQNGEISDKSYKYDLFQVKDGAFTLLTQ